MQQCKNDVTRFEVVRVGFNCWQVYRADTLEEAEKMSKIFNNTNLDTKQYFVARATTYRCQ